MPVAPLQNELPKKRRCGSAKKPRSSPNREPVTEDESAMMLSIPLPEIQLVRDFFRILIARAKYRIGTGNVDGAVSDVLAIHRAARRAARQDFFIQGLNGLAIADVGRGIGIGANPKYPPTKAEQYLHCPAETESDYALVIGGEHTPDALFLVEADKKKISPPGTVSESEMSAPSFLWIFLPQRRGGFCLS